MVYLYGYSPDRTLKGYVNNSLAYINISDLEQNSVPDDPKKHLNYTLPYCRCVAVTAIGIVHRNTIAKECEADHESCGQFVHL